MSCSGQIATIPNSSTSKEHHWSVPVTLSVGTVQPDDDDEKHQTLIQINMSCRVRHFYITSHQHLLLYLLAIKCSYSDANTWNVTFCGKKTQKRPDHGKGGRVLFPKEKKIPSRLREVVSCKNTIELGCETPSTNFLLTTCFLFFLGPFR